MKTREDILIWCDEMKKFHPNQEDKDYFDSIKTILEHPASSLTEWDRQSIYFQVERNNDKDDIRSWVEGMDDPDLEPLLTDDDFLDRTAILYRRFLNEEYHTDWQWDCLMEAVERSR